MRPDRLNYRKFKKEEELHVTYISQEKQRALLVSGRRAKNQHSPRKTICKQMAQTDHKNVTRNIFCIIFCN